MKALYAGSFDPITNGHIDIIEQAFLLCSELWIGVATNPDKQYMFSQQERLRLVKEVIADIPGNFNVMSYDGLTVEFANGVGASTLIRGLRAVSDFDIEFQMAQFNRKLGHGCNTIFLMPDENNLYLSSTAIRGIGRMGGDISQFVPPCVVRAFKTR